MGHHASLTFEIPKLGISRRRLETAVKKQSFKVFQYCVAVRTPEAERKGLLKTLLSACVGASIPRQKVHLLASEAGEGRTRLTLIELKQGEWTDEWPDVKVALEQWVVDELGGIYWPL